MRIRIKKPGNSLALRSPKSFAAMARLEQDSLVEGKVVMYPVAPPEVTLDQLLVQVTEENLHPEVDTGTATGNEFW